MATQMPEGGAPAPEKKKSSLVLILIVVGVIVVIAIGAGAYFLTRDDDSSSKAEGKAPPRISKDLYAAWQDDDRTAAAGVATAAAVSEIFAIPANEGDGLDFGGCDKVGDAPLPKDCVYSRPGGQLTITVAVVDGKRVATAVKLGPAATTPTS
jgi:hypothetical protein